MKKIGIYKFTNKFNGKSYIGQSTDIIKRYSSHKLSDPEDGTIFHRAIKKYGIENFKFEILEECLREELNEKEKYWIEYYNTIMPNGYNMTEGGNNYNRLKVTPKEIIESYIITKSIYKTAKELGIHRHTVSKILDENNIKKQERVIKPVCAIDKNTNEIVKVFQTIVEGAKFIGLSDSSIRNVLSGKSKSAGGYYWKYLEDAEKIEYKEYNKNKKQKVCQYSLNNELLNTFDSIREANIFLNKNPRASSIGKACRGEYAQAYGYIWRYAENV